MRRRTATVSFSSAGLREIKDIPAGTLDALRHTMSFLDLQDLATVAAQMDLWPVIVRWCSECDAALDALELVAATAVVALVLKRRKVDL
jgi:uncharacterized protein (UPF0212 family)